MQGPLKRDGKGNSTMEVWCGAGRSEFFNGRSCPTRLPIVEIELSYDTHRSLLERCWAAAGIYVVLNDEVRDWMITNLPKSRVEETYEDMICLRFDSPESYVLFKMFWL